VVSSKKKSTVMSPIRRQMKKRNPSGGQNGQLVHWWVLIHSGRDDALKTSGPFLLQSLNSIAAQFDLLVLQEITREL
jgi:hypothetical protein